MQQVLEASPQEVKPYSRLIAQPKARIAAFVNERQGLAAETPWVEPYTALGLERGGKLVAGVIYNFFDGLNCFMHVGAIEGRHWLNQSFLFAAFDYPFNQLGRRRVTSISKAGAREVHAFLENLGFKCEGVMQGYFHDADAVIYGMVRERCRFLDMRQAA